MSRRRFSHAATVAALLAAVVACSTLEVKVGWDEHVDFSKYHTWEWKPDGSIRDPVWSRRCEDVLSDTLETRGLKPVNQDADLWAVVHARLSSETEVVSYNPGWGYGWGPWGPAWAMDETVAYQIPVGTILVDLVDPRLKQIVWRGRAHDVIDPNKSNEAREEKLRQVLAQMFAGYPPSAPPASKP